MTNGPKFERSRRELARSFAAQVVAQLAEDALSGWARCQLAQLLRVGLHRIRGRGLEIDLRAHGAGDAVQRLDRRIRVRAFELGNGRLADAGELREFGLRQAQVLAHPAQLQLHGELWLDRDPEHRSLASLEGPRWPRREPPVLQVRLKPQLQGFLRLVLDGVARRREGLTA